MAPARRLPGRADQVRVRTHFRTDGGYVDSDGLVLWATLAPGHDPADFTPGTSCVVRAVHSVTGTVVVAAVPAAAAPAGPR